MIDEIEIECPYCGEAFPAPVEMEAGSHNYVEECEHCNHDIELDFESNGNAIIHLQVNAVET